jgi:hypothetical protein
MNWTTSPHSEHVRRRTTTNVREMQHCQGERQSQSALDEIDHHPLTFMR